MNLSKQIKIRKVAAQAASGTDAVTATAVDTSGHDGVLFVTSIATANAGNTLKIQQGGTDLTGAEVAAEQDGQLVYIDVYRPLAEQGKELTAVVTRGAATATGDVIAILYNGRTRPEVNLVDAADGIKGLLVISPETE